MDIIRFVVVSPNYLRIISAIQQLYVSAANTRVSFPSEMREQPFPHQSFLSAGDSKGDSRRQLTSVHAPSAVDICQTLTKHIDGPLCADA